MVEPTGRLQLVVGDRGGRHGVAGDGRGDHSRVESETPGLAM